MNWMTSVDEGVNPYLQSDSGSDTEQQSPPVTHIKCIGTTHHPESQEALTKVATLMKKGMKFHLKISMTQKPLLFNASLDPDWLYCQGSFRTGNG